MEPLISIIIPSYNRASLIGDTLSSLLCQTYINWECIIVDDNSNDNIEEIVKSFLLADSRFKFYKRPSELLKGANSCRNYGYLKSSGEYIKWFDSDDILHENCLSVQIDKLLNSENSISICEYHLFKDKNDFSMSPQYNYENVGDVFKDFIQGKIVLNTQIILFKRKIVENYFFDEDLMRAQDLDFIFRVLKDNHNNIILIKKVLVQIRAHSNSITGNFHKGNIDALNSEIKVRKAIFDNVNISLYENNVKNSVLKNYLNSFRALLIHGFYPEYKAQMREISQILSCKKKIYISILLLVAAFYNKTKKGLYLYGKISKKI